VTDPSIVRVTAAADHTRAGTDGEETPVTAIEPGLRLTDRYRIEELLLDSEGVRSWRAVDEVLSRSVLVQSLPANDPRTPDLMTAARAAALVRDARFLRILDVGTHDGFGYLIREWLPGVNLRTVLASDSAMTPDRAGALTREIAEALTSAHEQGLCHLALRPDSVIIGVDGSVKVTGLATDAVIRRVRTDDPARTDAMGAGRILYAALTGRWPGDQGAGLRPAPMVDGRLPSPRQVRAGVPRMLDEVADRTLGEPPRHQAQPLSSPAEVAAALAAALPGPAMRGMNPAHTRTTPAPALVDVRPLAEPRTPVPGPMSFNRPPEPLRGRSQMRLLRVIATVLLLSGTALFGLQLLLESVSGNGGGGASDSPTGSVTQPATPLAVTAARDFDPFGNGSESPRTVAQAFDGDSSTAWTTQEYYDPLEQQKRGVGLVLDAGEVREVSGVRLQLLNGGSDLEVQVAAEATSFPSAIDGWTSAASRESAPGEVELTFDAPVRTRYVLVWFTKLPQVDGVWRDGIAEAELLGP